MSDSALRVRNRGAYSSPFSGVGVEFLPQGILPDHSGLVLHEAGYLPRNDWWNFPSVLSPFWRLYYNFRSGHHVVFQDRAIELTPAHIMLIPDSQLFDCRGQKPVPSFWLAFNSARRLAAGQTIPILLRPSTAELALLRQLRGMFGTKLQSADREGIFHASMALLHLVLSRHELHWMGRLPESLVETIRYIEEHYAAPLSIPQLAKRVNSCTETLARCFKKYQGETLGRFITKVRVREAARLLAQTDQSIDEIAEQVGFTNRAYLSRMFKKATGESPAAFRRRF